MTWLYQDKELSDEAASEYVGFVYCITNLSNGKKYLGKKLFQFTRTKKVKGKTRRRKERRPSDWRTYWGSNDTLIADVKELGESNFKREILHLCKSKGTANYLEAKEIILHNALESDQYYNDWIMVKVHRSHIKV